MLNSSRAGGGPDACGAPPVKEKYRVRHSVRSVGLSVDPPPANVISHRTPLSRAPEAYRMFNDKTDDCTKIVLDSAA